MAGAAYPSLSGRRVIVTGGATGIGAGLVEAFAAQGCKVHFLDVQAAEARALERSLAHSARPPHHHLCDVTDASAIERVLASIGPVDVLINNAANDDRHALGDLSATYLDERLAVNLRHHLLCARAVAPAMAAQRRGVIVNLGSIAWRLGLADMAGYAAAKAGIEGMTRALARELGVSGIRVVCLAPGSVRTPRQLKWYPTPEAEAEILEKQCLKGRLEPSDVAAFALFLASDDARFCTGQTYIVDGGWS